VRELLSGMAAAGGLVAALYFLRFWRLSKDRLFLLFSLGFFLMGLNHLGLGLTDVEDESRTAFYILRLAGFILIASAIVDRNRRD
jgi:hypothetical protein